MGFQRAIELCRITDADFRAFGEHFPYERELYSWEWRQEHGEEPAEEFAEARTSWREGHEQHILERFIETDSKAPRPRLRAIKAEIDRLEGRRPRTRSGNCLLPGLFKRGRAPLQ